MRVGLVGQKGNARATSIVADLRDRLTGMGVELVVDEVTADRLDTVGSSGEGSSSVSVVPVDAMADGDLVVSIGGDGTFLYAARGAGSTPVMGVNLGEVGFLNAVAPDDAVEAVASEVRRFQSDGAVRTREIPRLRASGDDWRLRPALNEVAVQGPQRGHGGGATVEVRVDGSRYSDGHADGVLISTPTGSTAYNLSEEGPLVHPAVDGFAVTPMCAEEEMPSLVVDPDSELTLRVGDAEAGYVVGDGREQVDLDPPETIAVERAAEPVAVAGPPLDFFAALGKLD
jgi:NAD+ kinase